MTLALIEAQIYQTCLVQPTFGYAGMMEHQPSGLNLTWYRAYSPRDGRWLSEDPIGLEGWVNLYGYVGGDVVNYYDPLGLTRWDKLYNLPKDFWHWAHRHAMDITDLPEKEAKELAKEWERLGKPKPDNKRKHRQDGFVDISVICELLTPWWLVILSPNDTGGCDENGKCNDMMYSYGQGGK